MRVEDVSRSASPGRSSARAEKASLRREAIALSALKTFSENGYAATRLEDVARQAGVAKGTIYLHFKDKQALFEEMVRSVLVTPLREAAQDTPRPGESVRAFLERRLVPLLADLGTSRRGDVVRLLVAEGARFPELAQLYHREVVETGTALVSRLARRARESGEIGHDLLERFPQLLVAPALVGVMWGGLFERFQHLDVPGLIAAQIDLVFGPRDDAAQASVNASCTADCTAPPVTAPPPAT